jgi:hypothetical protein
MTRIDEQSVIILDMEIDGKRQKDLPPVHGYDAVEPAI